MTIYEPATLLTDYLLAILGAVLAWRLHRRALITVPAVRWWFLALVVLSISALVGGSYHGFAPNFSTFVDRIWWQGALWIICLLGYTMGNALICELVPTHRQAIWKRLVIGKFLLASAGVIFSPNFIVVIIDYGSIMLLWALAALTFRRRWSAWVITAVLLSALAAWIQQSGLSLSTHLNHNDIFHIIQAFALLGFYQSACLMTPLKAAD